MVRAPLRAPAMVRAPLRAPAMVRAPLRAPVMVRAPVTVRASASGRLPQHPGTNPSPQASRPRPEILPQPVLPSTT
jgi:hypothetical protein